MTKDPVLDLHLRLWMLQGSILSARSLEQWLRWTFYALLAACALLTASRIWDFPGGRWALGILLAPVAVPILHAIWTRLSLRDVAILLDRTFRLDERVSTAVENPGALGGALAADALRAVRGVDLGLVAKMRWPRETPFLAIAGLVALALWALPSPERAREADPALRAAAREEKTKILAAAVVREKAATPETNAMAAELEAIAALLETGSPESVREALARLRALEERATGRMLEGATGSELEALREIAERAAGSGAALARALDAGGNLPKGWNEPPPSVVKKMGREGIAGGAHAGRKPAEWIVKDLASSGPSVIEARETVRRTLERKDWPARCDAAVRNYFTE